MARRLLPELAYDFWAEDGRDRKWRALLDPWKRSVITLEWAVNEKKVLCLLRARQR